MLRRPSISRALLLAASSPLSAQVVIDAAKINCSQFATYKIADPDRIAIWLNGYFHGKRGDLTVDTQELAGNTDKIKTYCLENPDAPLLQAVETIFGPQDWWLAQFSAMPVRGWRTSWSKVRTSS